jgi:hypothetical protein
MEKMNIARLMQHSDLILVGQVLRVTDGFGENRLPYTEVTIHVIEPIKGSAGGNYTFRQFGLASPRAMDGGRTYLGMSPDGWPTFEPGEHVVVFLYPTTALGFQSTVGLLQGKFRIENSRVFNAIENAGLFDGLSVDPALLAPGEKKMVGSARGRCDSEAFFGFVRKAVQEGWFGPSGSKAPRGIRNED